MSDPSPNSPRQSDPPPPTPPSHAHTRTRSLSRSLFRRSSVVSAAEADDIEAGVRHVRLNNYTANAERNFLTNHLRSAKYTPLSLVPKALFEQFRRVSNFYFLIIAIISFIPGVSPTTPLANIFPLFIVVGFGFARDVYEDLQRAREDARQNAERQYILARVPEDIDSFQKSLSLVSASTAASLQKVGLEPDLHRALPSRDIAVGDIVLVRKGHVFPCDLVLMHSAEEGGVAYVSTANLDGESNLKRALVAAPTSDLRHPSLLRSLSGKVRAQPPSTALHEFNASIEIAHQDPAPLTSANLLLRGSILRNTDYIYGLCVYTGFDTKVALNMRNPPSKMGSVEKKLNWVVLVLFLALAALVIGASIASAVLQENEGSGQWYMGEFRDRSGASAGVKGLATFFILFSTFIPVSLFVTLEFIRLVQALFMSADFRMKTNGRSVSPHATNLNEMLGEVEHILSDKTGTLTENIMRYVACSADGKIYNVLKQKQPMQKAVKKNVESVRELILAMALCHSVVPEPKSEAEEGSSDDEANRKRKKRLFRRSANAPQQSSPSEEVDTSPTEDDSSDGLPEYQGQSPDEVALVTSAREYGIALLRRTLDTIVVDRFGVEETYSALAELEFNSDRKRMSMIFKCPDGKIRMFTKGADTIMLQLLEEGTDLPTIQEHIDEFAKEGLRTLVFASREFEESDFVEWFERFQEASSSLEDRESKVATVSAELEQNLHFIATTAVEDKLQDKVPETIKFMREAGIKLWVLTGDKRETAENIGYSANLLDKDMDVVHIKGGTSDEVGRQLTGCLDRHIADGDAVPQPTTMRRGSSIAGLTSRLSSREKKVKEKELGIIIDGASLHFAIEDHSQIFMALSDHTKVVICCRVTPLQKALVVRLVREERRCLTLAIGDGGNDVSMIQEAHIGVGLYGKEGTQAARASDYAMGEFKHLLRLTALHGRYSSVRSAGMINLSFYKNIFYTLTNVFFQVFDFATGQTFNNQWVSAAFNVVVTSATPFLFGIFERDLDESTLVRFPSVYATNRERKLFSLKSVFEYTALYGLWHAVVVYFGVYLLFGYLKIDFRNGKDSGLFLSGFANATIATAMTLFKMTLHSHTLNWLVLLGLVLSVLIFVLVVPLAIYVVSEYPLEGILEMLFSSVTFYLAAAVIMVCGFFLDYIILVGRQLLYPDVVTRLQQWEQKARHAK